MKAKRLLGTVLAGGLGLLAMTFTGDALAQGKKPKKEAAPPPITATPMTKKPIKLLPEGLAWGMSPKQVAELVDKQVDADYDPVYKKTSPGVKMKALDAQVAEAKSAFRRSRIDFGKLPTGVDSTPLKGEYSYLNKECMLTLERPGHAVRHYFFIQDKLWKFIDDYNLNEGSSLGKTFQEAVVNLATKVFSAVGRVQQPDFAAGRPAMEIDWKDQVTHVRVIERGETALAIAYEDIGTVNNLAVLRPNKPAQDDGIDPAVAAAVGRVAAPPEKPAEAAPPEKTGKSQKKQ